MRHVATMKFHFMLAKMSGTNIATFDPVKTIS